MSRIAILGAGLMGRLLAHALTDPKLNSSFEVTLFDEQDHQAENSAAYLAAAMLAPLAESAEASENIMLMGERSLTLWPQLLENLQYPVFFQQQGSLILSYEQDREYLLDFQRRLKRHDPVSVQAVKAQRIMQLEPALKNQTKQFHYGLFLPNEGQLNNRELLDSLAATLQSRKITWHTFTQTEHQSGQTVTFNRQSETFDWVIDCRGMGAQQQVPAAQPLRGVRGEVIRVHAPQVNLNRPVRLMHPRYPIYIAPKANHHFVIGATQIESEDQRQPTVRSALELLSSCFSLHKGFAEAEILEVRSGLRPALPNNEPKIWVKNRHLSVNGLFRHGYLLAPALVEQCLGVLGQEESSLDNYTQIQTPYPSVVEVQT